jgi:hypothetical protein
MGGCATPLDISKNGPPLAQAVGIPSENIQFISYCSFGECRVWEKELIFIEGILVVTPDSIHLFGGNLNDLSQKQEIKLTYQKIDGIDIRRYGKGRQIQILNGEHLVVIEITKNKAFIDQEGSEQIYELITKRGIKVWHSKRYYRATVPSMIFIPLIIK